MKKQPSTRFSMRAAQALTALAIAITSTTAYAQIDEIVVTATKRAESIQSVPLSISAISGEDLESRGAIEFFDYATSIPNLSFGAVSDGVLANRSISLRGIAGENTTGVYIDDTPISETIDPRILDLERIEVLRGPQGTLYGARSLGGTIRQITAKPDFDEVHGKVRAHLSSTDESDDLDYLVSGTINIPFSDSVAGKFSALYEDRAGVFDRQVGTIADFVGAPATFAGSPTAVIEDVDSQQTLALSATVLFEVNDRLTIQPRVMYQNTELDGYPLADISPGNFNQNRSFDVPEFAEDEWTLSTLNINYDAGFGTFTSATSVFDRETFEGEASGSFINFLLAGPIGVFGAIGEDRPVISPIFHQLEFETFVQEFRFSSSFDGPTNFVAGAFYQDTDDNENFVPRNFATGLEDNFALFQQALGVPGPLEDFHPFGDLVFTSEGPEQVEELGVFGELTHDINDQLSIVLGARWYDTEVNFTSRRAGFAFGVPLADDQPLSTIPAESGSQNEDGSIFKAAIQYQATDDLFLYASIAEGFRLGGANVRIPDTLGCPDNLADLGLSTADTSQFESDELTNYEIGVKADFSGIARLNASAFFIDFEEIQQNVALLCGFQFVGNFGAAESKGFEVEFFAQLTDTLYLTANAGYTDAEFTETVAGVTAGTPLQFVPEITLAMSVDYESGGPVIGNMDLFGRFDFSYVDDSISVVNSEPRERDGYEQMGFRLGLRNEKYSVTLFARNLSNEIANLADARSLAAETPNRSRFVTSRPRSFGVQVTSNF